MRFVSSVVSYTAPVMPEEHEIDATRVFDLPGFPGKGRNGGQVDAERLDATKPPPPPPRPRQRLARSQSLRRDSRAIKAKWPGQTSIRKSARGESVYIEARALGYRE